MINKRAVINESVGLIGVVVVTLLLDFWLFGQSSLNRRLVDVQLHDTIYGLPSVNWLQTIFVLISLSVYLVKEGRKGFRRALPNIVLSFLLLLALVVLFYWHRITFRVQTGGWVVYPPLSSSSDLLEKIERSYSPSGNLGFSILELTVATGLFLPGFRTGRVIGNTEPTE